MRTTEEQERLRRALRELLEREFPLRSARSAGDCAADSPLWRRLAEEGFLSVAFDRNGDGFSDACLVLEELGRVRAATPFLTSVALCGMAIERWGSSAQRDEILPALAKGGLVVAYGGGEDRSASSLPTLRHNERGEGYLLDGEVNYVPYAEIAGLLLVAATRVPGPAGGTGGEDPEVVLLLVAPSAPGVVIEPLRTVDRDHYCRVQFERAPISRNAFLGEDDSPRGASLPREEPFERIAEWGAAARCAEMVGGAAHVLEMCTEYATRRRQFGRPIGSFQAIQHRCADMAVDLLASRLLASEAIWRLSTGLEASREVSAAKAWTGEAYQRICAAGHQIHGALGYTGGHPMQLFTRHAYSASLQFGDSDYHHERLARALGI